MFADLFYSSFILTIIMQFLVYLAFVFFLKKKGVYDYTNSLILLLISIPIGIAYDIYIGTHLGMFSYIYPYTVFFALINGFFSYGIAQLTVGLILPNSIIPLKEKSRVIVKYIFALVIALLGAFFFVSMGSFLKLVMAGGILMAFGEGIILLCGQQGPLVSVLHKNIKPFCITFCLASIMAVPYEIFNLLHPLWIWNLLPELGVLQIELLIIFGGYFVLVHTMLVLAFLVKKIMPSTQS